MKFDPVTKRVYTERDEFIKTMHCPYKVRWGNLQETSSTSRKCAQCDHLVIDTEFLSDAEVLRLVNANPATCLKIDLNQHNVKLRTDGILEQK